MHVRRRAVVGRAGDRGEPAYLTDLELAALPAEPAGLGDERLQ
jgi:hypothetical protein